MPRITDGELAAYQNSLRSIEILREKIKDLENQLETYKEIQEANILPLPEWVVFHHFLLNSFHVGRDMSQFAYFSKDQKGVYQLILEIRNDSVNSYNKDSRGGEGILSHWRRYRSDSRNYYIRSQDGTLEPNSLTSIPKLPEKTEDDLFPISE